MAKRRCFSIDVVESLGFRILSPEAKTLYFGLLAHSDDEGVVINPSIPMFLYDLDERALNELEKSNFVLKVDDIYVIKHWHQHNRIQPSKLVESFYRDELSRLSVNNRKEYEFK